MSGLDLNTYYGKISKLGRVFNKLNPNQVRDAIEVAEMNFNKDMRDISKVHLKDGTLDIQKVKIKKKEPIEYVVKEEKQDNEMEL